MTDEIDINFTRLFGFLSAAFGALLLVGALVLPRAYGTSKLPILAALLISLMLNNISKGFVLRMKGPGLFFFVIILLNVFALIVGFLFGNPTEAIVDGARFGVVFPILIALLWTFLADFRYEGYLRLLIEFSAITLSIIIFLTIYQEFSGVSVFPADFVQENLLFAGIHGGYIQVVSHGVGSLFFLSGYLFYYVIADESGERIWITRFALVLVLIAGILSGRRALQFELLSLPLFSLFSAFIFRHHLSFVRVAVKPWLLMLFFAAISAYYLVYFDLIDFNNSFERFSGVIETDGGRRSEQARLLFLGIFEYPIFGSGIGGGIDWKAHV